MVYPAYREVCDDDDYVDVDDHEEEEKEEDEKGDKEEETKCDQSGQPGMTFDAVWLCGKRQKKSGENGNKTTTRAIKAETINQSCWRQQ